MLIFVKYLNTKTLNIEILKDEIFSDIKRKIQEKLDVAPQDQILTFQGIILEDDKTVDQYGIMEKSIIKVISRSGMMLFAKTIQGKIITLEVTLNQTIIDVKKEIQEEIGLELDDFYLQFQGGPLENEKTVEDYQIADKSMINIIGKLRNKVMAYTKTINGKKVPFEVTPNKSVFDSKREIQEEIGLPTSEYYLQFNGKCLDDSKTMNYYQVTNKSVINVIIKLRGGVQIFAKTIDGKSVAIEIFKHEKVIDLKRKIHEKTGMSPDEQKLIYQGLNLENDKTMDEYQIVEKSVVNIVARRVGMQVLVKTLDGRTVAIDLLKSEKVQDLKEKIRIKMGLAVEEQKLVFNGKLLEEEMTLDELQLVEKSVINLIVRLKGGIRIFKDIQI